MTLNARLGAILLILLASACSTNSRPLSAQGDLIVRYDERYRSDEPAEFVRLQIENNQVEPLCISARSITQSGQRFVATRNLAGEIQATPVKGKYALGFPMEGDVSALGVIPIFQQHESTFSAAVALGSTDANNNESTPLFIIPYANCRRALESPTIVPTGSDILAVVFEFHKNGFSDARLRELANELYPEWSRAGGKIGIFEVR